jgi:chromosome segregation ATPase
MRQVLRAKNYRQKRLNINNSEKNNDDNKDNNDNKRHPVSDEFEQSETKTTQNASTQTKTHVTVVNTNYFNKLKKTEKEVYRLRDDHENHKKIINEMEKQLVRPIVNSLPVANNNYKENSSDICNELLDQVDALRVTNETLEARNTELEKEKVLVERKLVVSNNKLFVMESDQKYFQGTISDMNRKIKEYKEIIIEFVSILSSKENEEEQSNKVHNKLQIHLDQLVGVNALLVDKIRKLTQVE